MSGGHHESIVFPEMLIIMTCRRHETGEHVERTQRLVAHWSSHEVNHTLQDVCTVHCIMIGIDRTSSVIVISLNVNKEVEESLHVDLRERFQQTTFSHQMA